MPPIDETISVKPAKPKAPVEEPNRATNPTRVTEPTRARESTPAGKPPSATEQQPNAGLPNAGLIAFTIDTTNGSLVTIERVDATGAHHALSQEEKRRLATAQTSAPLKQLVEQAFEAGIECVLGKACEDNATESKSEGELRHLLLESLIERSSAKHLFESENLNRAIVGTLIGR